MHLLATPLAKGTVAVLQRELRFFYVGCHFDVFTSEKREGWRSYLELSSVKREYNNSCL